MASLAETLGDGSGLPIHDALVAGLDVLSGDQEVSFTPYIRTVLPLDGFVFWLRASILPSGKLAENGLTSADPVVVKGSLHYASIGNMSEDETIAVRRVDFTAESQIDDFDNIAPTVMYVGNWNTDLGSFRFAFSQRSSFYQQAKLYHYVGDAVYPVFERMLIDDIGGFDQRQVVSNSIPLWLAMVQSVPFVSLVTSGVQLYPAYFVPPNLEPPYGVVDISPTTTRAVQAAAWRGADSSRYQLIAERANLIFYGLRNDEVMDFLDYAVDYTSNTGEFGITNMPVVRDERRSQIELSTLAVKKSVEFEISYYQQRARDVAQILIGQCRIGYIRGSDHPFVPEPPPFIIGPLT